jgi:hypothetical protein
VLVWVPFPSWPEPFQPQHVTPPALVSAQVWLSPAEIAVIAGLVAGGDDVAGGVVTGGDDVGGGVAGAGLGGEVVAGGDEVGGGVVTDGAGVGPDGGGVVSGAGLEDDAQAATSSPSTIVVATGNSEGRIPCPPDGM